MSVLNEHKLYFLTPAEVISVRVPFQLLHLPMAVFFLFVSPASSATVIRVAPRFTVYKFSSSISGKVVFMIMNLSLRNMGGDRLKRADTSLVMMNPPVFLANDSEWRNIGGGYLLTPNSRPQNLLIAFRHYCCTNSFTEFTVGSVYSLEMASYSSTTGYI